MICHYKELDLQADIQYVENSVNHGSLNDFAFWN